MKNPISLLILMAFIVACSPDKPKEIENPFLFERNDQIRFDLITTENIKSTFDLAKSELATQLDDVTNVPDQDRNFENTIQKIDDFYDRLSSKSSIIYLMGSTHPDSATRETALQIRNEFAKIYNELQLNENLYKAVKSYSQTPEAAQLTGFKKKYVDEMVTEFERNGFALDLERREQLKVLLDEISLIGNEFSTNIAAYQDFLIVSEAEMEGLPEDFKSAHKQADGTYKIGLSYPDYIPFMKNSTSSGARQKLFVKYNNRAADKNLDVLNKLLIKRNEMANLLGYPTFADYQTETRMAKNPETVWAFETNLTEKLLPKGQADYQEIIDYQKSIGISGDKVNSWDKSYLIEELKAKNYGVDEEIVRQYFALENVMEGLFSITQNLFGVTYKKMENAYAWHPEVVGYEVFENGELIGRFYLDLHPRANKYSHAACFGMVDSKQWGSERQIPQATLVCNFTQPTADKPALMTHSEVETFFHEFGHVLHHLLSKTTLGSQSGTSVSRDFVEAPSQIFENWVWDYRSLSLFAKHYQTGEVLPVVLYEKMKAAKNVMSGLNALTQVFYGTYDMTLHNKFDPQGAVSTTDVAKELMGKVTLFDYVPETHFEAAFGHLYGYAASYYGYLWSEVYAQDMFSRFEAEGILNPEVGKAYREKVLARGSEEDEMQMLRDFLGREPNQEAFIKSLGLEN